MEDLFFETRCEIGLFPVLSNPKVLLHISTDQTQTYPHRHAKVCHILSEQYQSLSNIVKYVSYFSRLIRSRFQCVPFLTAKMQKAPIKALVKTSLALTENYYDLSGLFKESTNKKKHAVHLLDTRTLYSKAYTTPTNAHPTNIYGFVTNVNRKSFIEGITDRIVRSHTALENFMKELREYCNQTGNHIQPPPPLCVRARKQHYYKKAGTGTFGMGDSRDNLN